MYKIKILDSNEEFLYPNFKEFIVNFIYHDCKNIDFTYCIDEENINFQEYQEFLSILLKVPFTNPDHCKTVEELIDWTKSAQFLSLLEEELLS